MQVWPIFRHVVRTTITAPPGWWTKAEWWSAIGTVSAVAVALFGETIWAWLRRPKLDLSISVQRPDCVRTKFTDTTTGRIVADCYYFRVLVGNRGKRRAEDVEVYAERLEREEGGKFAAIVEFPPMDLVWSHVGKPLQSISPGLRKHCDLGYIALHEPVTPDELLDQMFDPTVSFCFTLEVKPNQGGWSIGVGTYRLHLALAAANVAKVQRRVLEIKFGGQWMEDETEMFEQGIQIRVVEA